MIVKNKVAFMLRSTIKTTNDDDNEKVENYTMVFRVE